MPEDFFKWLSLEKRYSPHTVNSYRTDLEQFQQYLQEFYETPLTGAAAPMIKSWMVKFLEAGKKATTVSRKLASLNTYYKYMVREGLLTANPAALVTAPKREKRLAHFATVSEMEALLSPQFFDDSFDGLRNRFILELFYACGLRLSELIELKLQDVDLNQKQLKVMGKRRKERIIPFNNRVADILKPYLEEREKNNGAGLPYLFLHNEKKLYKVLVYRMVRQHLQQVSTAGKYSPHVLRHTFATHLLNNGADVNAIKELLGHSSLAATQVYTHNTIDLLKDIHKQAHPKGKHHEN